MWISTVADDSAHWVIATGNPGKQREFEEILGGAGIDFGTLAHYAPVTFPDEGLDYRSNAIAKARAVASQTHEVAVADDSGIEVTALGGAPGPISARYGGEGLDDRGRVEKLLSALAEEKTEDRSARFVCYAALATPEGDTVVAYGECRGVILEAPQGEEGFGYDPIFMPEGYSQSMAELDKETKNRISHRARALQDLQARWSTP
ncbi:MAG: non-canonical purine NTP pyrophosphatase (RdgB/HAM1 family) [Myxococcota bacterium]